MNDGIGWKKRSEEKEKANIGILVVEPVQFDLHHHYGGHRQV
jgi:hypothetical protein